MIVKKDLVFKDKLDALTNIAKLAEDEGFISNYRLFLKGLIERENTFSTGMGDAIAIPHCKCEDIQEVFIIICTLKNKIQWQSIDNQDVDFIITLGIPSNNIDNNYLSIMSKLAKNLMNKEFIKELKSLDSETEIINKIKSTIS